MNLLLNVLTQYTIAAAYVEHAFARRMLASCYIVIIASEVSFLVSSMARIFYIIIYPSILDTFGTEVSVPNREVPSFRCQMYIILMFGTVQAVLIRGVSLFQGCSYRGVPLYIYICDRI